MSEQKEIKCYEYTCPLFPKCETAGMDCCGVDDFFEGVTLTKEQCFDLPDKPYFKEKKNNWYKPGCSRK